MTNLYPYLQPTLYTIIAVLYLCVGDVFQFNQTYTTPVHGLYLALTMLYVLLCLLTCRLNKVMVALAVLYFLNIAYGWFFHLVGFGSSGSSVDALEYVSTYFNSISAVFIFYYFSEKGMVDKRWFTCAAVVFAVVVFFQYQFMQIRQAFMLNKEIGEFTDNSGYSFLAVLPVAAFLRPKPILMYSMVVYLSAMMLTCTKRGAVIIAAFVVVYLLYQITKTSRHKIQIIILSLALIVGLGFFLQYLFENSALFVTRVNETVAGNTSARDVIYAKVWETIVHDNNIVGYIVGNGPWAPLRLCGVHAHNDWLEIGLSMGLMGIIVYLFYWVTQISTLIQARRKGVDQTIIIALTSVVFIHLMKSFFSMSADSMMIYSTSVMGYCFSQCNQWILDKQAKDAFLLSIKDKTPKELEEWFDSL